MSEQLQWQLVGVYFIGVFVCAFALGMVRQLRPEWGIGQGDGSLPFLWPTFVAFAIMSAPVFALIGLVYLPTKAGERTAKFFQGQPR